MWLQYFSVSWKKHAVPAVWYMPRFRYLMAGWGRKSISFLHFRETRRAGRKSQKEEIYSSKHTRVQTGTDKADIKQKYKSSMISARHSSSSWIDVFPHFPRRVKEMHLIFHPCLFFEARRRCLKKDIDLVFHLSWYSGSWSRFLVQKDYRKDAQWWLDPALLKGRS